MTRPPTYSAPVHDLAVRYEWRAGPIPRGHWEQSVAIDPGGLGKVTVMPDYPSARTPVWTERFVVPGPHLDWLRGVMTEHGLFDRAWSAARSPRVGGSSESLAVQSQGRSVVIPPNVDEDDEAAAAAICAAVQQLVPPAIREALAAKRQEYMRSKDATSDDADPTRPRGASDYRVVGALLRRMGRGIRAALAAVRS